MSGFKFPAATMSALIAVTAVSAGGCRASAAEPPQPLALQSVMQQLGRDLQAVTAAIAKEDWAEVARLAPTIARHPGPPLSEKLRILAWLGADAGRFRAFDGEVHDAALAVGDAASKADGQAVIADFAKVQQGCLGCHQSFRARFREHFYGTP